ncbi:unnamed protein product [Larinioides sclopetarius]|uniref:Uncharacterized protein n=1 Tax=Larinioides sclopetarius TaxID=280406 RepID=A0AAV2AL43_9ARAC
MKVNTIRVITLDFLRNGTASNQHPQRTCIPDLGTIIIAIFLFTIIICFLVLALRSLCNPEINNFLNSSTTKTFS